MMAPRDPARRKLTRMSERSTDQGESGVGEALRAAIERTLAATAPAAAQTRDRAGELLDEIARRGQEAGAGLARRGQDAGAELARRGQGAQAELARQVASLEQRLASLEETLRRREPSGKPSSSDDQGVPNPKPEP